MLDSGVSDHEWLRGSFAEDPLPDEARGLWDLSAAALPRHVGHGTFVCGVVLHYAPATQLLPRRVLDLNGDAEDDQLAATIRGLIPWTPTSSTCRSGRRRWTSRARSTRAPR